MLAHQPYCEYHQQRYNLSSYFGTQTLKLSTRYGLVGIGALALLSGVHWLREQQMRLEPISEYLMGVTPNFAASIAINFVLMSI